MAEVPTPVDPDEPILRRIHRNNFNADLAIPIQTGAFRPSDEDHDGLSFFREREISAEALAKSGRKPAEEYVVARFKAVELTTLGLTLIPTDNPNDLPGHIIMPELNKLNYERNKQRSREVHLKLAQLGSKDVMTGFTSKDPSPDC